MKETKAFLNKVRKIDMLINNKLDEIQQLRSLAESTSISLGERVQSSGSKHSMADRIERIVDMEREVDAEIDRLMLAKKEVIEVIEQLPLEQYDLLYQVYIKGVELKCYNTDKSYTWVKSTHGRALVNVRDILRSRKCP
jgi:hypothetical protein